MINKILRGLNLASNYFYNSRQKKINMKIIFIEDVEKTGKKFELKNIKSGYARNFLIPKKLAVLATKKNMELYDKEKEKEELKKEKTKKELQKIADKLKDFKIKIFAKVGEKGKFFEKVRESKIAKLLQKEGFDIKKENIKLKEPIEKKGTFDAFVLVGKELKVKIKVIVSEEKTK